MNKLIVKMLYLAAALFAVPVFGCILAWPLIESLLCIAFPRMRSVELYAAMTVPAQFAAISLVAAVQLRPTEED